VVADLGFSLFERAWTMAGMETILVGMVEDPPFVHALLDGILAFNLAIIERACSRDIDAMQFGDDWGQQRGLLMGPTLWREFIKPRVRRMYGLVKSRGKKVFIHSCGKVDTLFPDLIECGLDVFNPFQPEVMDVAEMKRLFGDRLSFFGGISTQKTLPYGTPAEVRQEVKRLLDTIGKSGGYIAAPAHSIPKDAKPENIAAMIEVLRDQ
jgi:uroporphyrinogen decarboxylase